jgi:L-ascorbate metabolism protein UlaG (beta-lactamase superfamily)
MGTRNTGIGAIATFAYRVGPRLIRRLSEDAKRSVESARYSPNIRAWPERGLHATWIGHSTVVLRIDGLLVVTDPVFSRRIGINIGPVTVGLKRLVEPAVTLRNLPTPDLILLSHAHMDHFDLPSLRKLANSRTTVVTARNTGDLLRANRYAAIHELGWGETVRVGSATIRAFEVKHWGARMQHDTHRGYNGYLIEAGRYRVLFGGDTAYTECFRRVRSPKRLDLGIMPIGAYDPWIHAHCNPEQALSMVDDAGAEFVLPVHHSTFQLSREPAEEPMQRLLQAAGSAEDRVCIRDFGEERHWD